LASYRPLLLHKNTMHIRSPLNPLGSLLANRPQWDFRRYPQCETPFLSARTDKFSVHVLSNRYDPVFSACWRTGQWAATTRSKESTILGTNFGTNQRNSKVSRAGGPCYNAASRLCIALLIWFESNRAYQHI